MGIVVQFCLGLFTIRWEPGRNIFKCTGDKVATFLNYTTVGASFVYGDFLIDNKVFAFQVSILHKNKTISKTFSSGFQ